MTFTPTTIASLIATAIQVITVVTIAPIVIGLMRQVRAKLEGRAGAGLLQPWRDLRKLLRRPPTTPTGTGWAFRLAPLQLMGTSLVIAAAIPLLTTTTALGSSADLLAVVGLLALGTIALALAALDTGTAFGGMGASREMMVLALAEPTILLAVFALSGRTGSTNLSGIVAATLDHPLRLVSPASVLAAAAFAVVVVAETGRLPVDNPATHLELTMIHEAMVLEYSGSDLAMVELASAVRLTALLGLFSSLFAPWGITVSGLGAASFAGLSLAVAALVCKVAILATLLAGVEVFLAKVRLFRVPELLAGSFVLAMLAVSTSFLLA